MKRYPAYKDSGIEWIEEIPVNWDLCKFKHCYQSNMGQTILKEDLSLDGQCPVYSATMGNEFFGAINNPQVELKQGDLVIPARGNSIGYVKIVDGYSTCTQTTVYSKRIPSKYTIEAKYAYYYLIGKKRDLFYFTRTAIPQITVDQVANNPFLVPSIAEQGLVVAYLDRKTVQIDDLIAKKEQMIELLKDERMAIINQAVTKGLDPKAEMKDSGIEWLGKIPKHWISKKIKYVSRVNAMALTETTEDGYKFNYIDISNVDLEEGLNISDKINFLNAPSRARRIVKKGDTIISTVRTYLKAIAYIGEVVKDVIVSTGFAVVSPQGKIIPKFLYYVLRSEKFIDRVCALSVGVSYPAINSTELANIVVWYPDDKEEQKKIADYLDYVMIKTKTAINRMQVGIEYLKEFRTSLISEVVTGKIDVQECAV